MSDVVNVGTLPNDGTGDPERDAFIAINAVLAQALLHLVDKGNPHAVTAKQVGAYSKIEADENLNAALQGLPTLANVATAISTAINALSFGTAATKNAGASAGNVPVLDSGGKLLANLLPAIAITDVFPVATQAAMLALIAQRGDVAIRTDQGIAYILSTDDPTTLSNWIALPLPTNVVLQVAGLSGPTIAASALTAALLSFTGDAGAGGTKGLVPAPAAGDAAKFLRGDGIFATPPGGSSGSAFNFCAALAF